MPANSRADAHAAVPNDIGNGVNWEKGFRGSLRGLYIETVFKEHVSEIF